MKKNGILHGELAGRIAAMGHMEKILIGDAGMPVPKGIPVVDLAVRCGVPSFQDVFLTILQELQVEKYYMAEETRAQNLPILQLFEQELQGAECVCMSHRELKEFSSSIKFAVRTGECTSFANVILQAGVVF